MNTRRLTSSVKMACPWDPSVVLCVTEGLSLEMRNRASDLCWSHTMYLFARPGRECVYVRRTERKRGGG